MAIDIILTIMTLNLVAGMFFYLRNQIVADYRISILKDSNHTVEENLTRYARLPSYDKMLWIQVWRWNWDDYLGDKE
jgi:hypothetical protein